LDKLQRNESRISKTQRRKKNRKWRQIKWTKLTKGGPRKIKGPGAETDGKSR
jgi:hypothetical protein